MTAGVFVLCRNPAETVSKKGLLKKWNNPFCFASINGVLRPLLKGGRPLFGLPAAEPDALPDRYSLTGTGTGPVYSSSSFSPSDMK
jgi:hypothetical protein